MRTSSRESSWSSLAPLHDAWGWGPRDVQECFVISPGTGPRSKSRRYIDARAVLNMAAESRDQEVRSKPAPRVSFVIPVRNDAVRLLHCLRTIKANAYP